MLYTQRMTRRHYAGRIKLGQMRIVSTSNNSSSRTAGEL